MEWMYSTPVPAIAAVVLLLIGLTMKTKKK